MESIAQLATERYPGRRLTLEEQRFVCHMIGLMSPKEQTYVRRFLEARTKQKLTADMLAMSNFSHEVQVALWVIVVLHNKAVHAITG